LKFFIWFELCHFGADLTHRITFFRICADIKALRKGKKEYGDQLKLLQDRKTELETRIKGNQKWAANFDGLIGPFEKKYDDLKDTIAGLYEIAKDKHTAGLQLLVRFLTTLGLNLR
jgi:hypothetical protein